MGKLGNMYLVLSFLPGVIAAAAAVPGFSAQELDARSGDLYTPSLCVPACPDLGNITYTNSVPSADEDPFPETRVAVCYDDLSIHILFEALNETSFYCMLSHANLPSLPVCACGLGTMQWLSVCMSRQRQRSGQWRYLRLRSYGGLYSKHTYRMDFI